MNPIEWIVCKEIKKYMFSDKRYLLAVSGGADSLALADAVATVFFEDIANIRVCHVEHGIRGAEALADAKVVENFCHIHGLSFVCCHVDVPRYALENNCSLEEAARKMRYAKLLEEAERFDAEAIVTAHQADDQAETVLWKLLRGAGTDGLSGMQIFSNWGLQKLVRPFLNLSRRDLEEYCKAKNLIYCIDSTNYDVKYTRNRIRKELIPYLESNFNPAIKGTLVREARLLAEEQACLAELTENYLQDDKFCGIVKAEGYFWVNAKLLSELPVALRKRILREAFFRVGGKELSYERTLALDKLCISGIGEKLVQLSCGFQAVYRNKKILIYKGVKNHA